MKRLIGAAAALVAFGGCVAVPAPYAGDPYYYPAPAVGVGVGVYAPPVVVYDRPHYRRYRGYSGRWR
jgi:hypothetical protein